jgi:hypothetical protein
MLFQVIHALALGPMVRVVIEVPELSPIALFPIGELCFHRLHPTDIGAKTPEGSSANVEGPEEVGRERAEVLKPRRAFVASSKWIGGARSANIVIDWESIAV